MVGFGEAGEKSHKKAIVGRVENNEREGSLMG